MQTLSSAKRTCMAFASAVEWTATVWIPISRQARWMRSAISPRLAIKTFSKTAVKAEATPRYSITMSGSPNSTGWPSSIRIWVTVPLRGAAIWFITFMASMMSTV